MPSNVHAVVPMKNLDRAKSRLAALLPPDERRDLALTMLRQVLETLVATSQPANGTPPVLAAVWVISVDPMVLDVARGLGAAPIFDTGDLNVALEQAKTTATVAGADALLVVPADVPLITANDVAALCRMLADGADLALAPDDEERGTNALALALPSAFRFRFGIDSFLLHSGQAQTSGLSTRIYRSPTLALDIDTPADLERLHDQHGVCCLQAC